MSGRTWRGYVPDRVPHNGMWSVWIDGHGLRRADTWPGICAWVDELDPDAPPPTDEEWDTLHAAIMADD